MSGLGLMKGLGRFQLGSKLNYTDEYKAVLSAMATEPTTVDKIRQNDLIRNFKNEGIWNEIEYAAIFASSNGGSLVNWKNPTKNPDLNGNPEFEEYNGYRGSLNNNIRLNFIPATDGINISQDNICVLIGIGSDILSGTREDFGGYSGSNIGRISIRGRYQNDSKAYFRLTSSNAIGVLSDSSQKYFVASRNNNSSYDVYLNKEKTSVSSTSNGLCSVELYACGSNEDGTIVFNNKIVKFVLILTYQTQETVNKIIDIMESYLQNYDSQIIGFDTIISKSYPETKTNISLDTYDGGGETVHPSVIDIGSEWNGYRYWMANTPYPSSNQNYENPSIWGSNDGLTWVVPAGVTNPIVPGGAGFYNADTELFYEGGTLYCFYKYADTNSGNNEIRVVSSTDGVNWGNEKTVLTLSGSESGNVSPAIVKVSDTYYMYYSSLISNFNVDGSIKRASCDTIDGIYTNKENLNIKYQKAKRYYWHIDVVYENGFFYLCSAGSKRTYISKGTDGINFQTNHNALMDDSIEVFDLISYYRPSLCKIDGQWKVYYSAQNGSLNWTTNVMDIELL